MKHRISDVIKHLHDLSDDVFNTQELITELTNDRSVDEKDRECGSSDEELDNEIAQNIKELDELTKEKETPINLSDCHIGNQLVLVRFTESGNHDYRSFGLPKGQPMVLLGEINQDHVSVRVLHSYQIFDMVHSFSLEIIPPDEW